MMTQQDWIIFAVLFGMLLMWKGSHYWKRLKGKQIQRRGKRGEARAIKILQDHGYRIIEEQVAKPVTITVDGKSCESTLYADMLVKKGRKTYVVEVKTGKDARPTVGHVRRQMLEYQIVFQPDGMLFIDVGKGSCQEVHFDMHFRNLPRVLWQYLMWTGLIMMFLGIVIGQFL